MNRMIPIFEDELPYDPRPQANKLVFSNFMLTISTNVTPANDAEHRAVSSWLLDQCNNLFDDWFRLNGTVLKPAGSDSALGENLGDDHLVEGVRSRITLERGGGERAGQVHAHVVLEVAHRYSNRNQFGGRGVHVNANAMRAYLNDQIYLMEIPLARQPSKIYVHCRLITALGKNQAKWLTLQYINKDVDKHGTDLTAQRAAGTDEERNIHAGLRQPDAEFNPLNWQIENIGVGGALPEYSGGFADDSPAGTQFQRDEEPQVAAPVRRAILPESEEASSSWDPSVGDRPVRAVWTTSGRTAWKKKRQ